MRIYQILFLSLIILCGCTSKGPEIRVGVDPSWYPLDLEGKESRVSAFASDFLVELATHKKLSLLKMQASSDNLLTNLDQGKYQAVLSSKMPYLFNQEEYQFSDPLLLTGPVLVVPKNSPVKNVEDLAEKQVAVTDNSTSRLIVEAVPGLLIAEYLSIPEALNDVVSGKVDGALIPSLLADSYVADLYRDKLEIATPPLNEEGIRLIVRRNQVPFLVPAFNEELKAMHADSRYEILLKKWALTIP